MAWSDLIDQGSGWLEFLLTIEGYDYAFATHEDLEANTTLGSDLNIVTGLKREGLKISFGVSIEDSEMEDDTMTAIIVDVDNKVTNAFARQPSSISNLLEEASKTQDFLSCSTVDDYTEGDYVYLGTESMVITSINSSSNVIDVDRAQFGSTQQRHPISTESGGTLGPTITKIPITIKNRKIRLYGFSNGDDLTSVNLNDFDSHVIWRGIIVENEEMPDAGTWKFSIMSLYELLRQKFGFGLGELPVRGYLHTGSTALEWNIWRKTDNQYNSENYDDSALIYINNHYETLDEMIYEMNNQLLFSGTANGWGSTIPTVGLMENNALGLFFNSGVSNLAYVGFTNFGVYDLKAVSTEYIFPGEYLTRDTDKGFYGWDATLGRAMRIEADDRDSAFSGATEANKFYVQPVEDESGYPDRITYALNENFYFVQSEIFPGNASSAALDDGEQVWIGGYIEKDTSNNAIRFPIPHGESMNYLERSVRALLGPPPNIRYTDTDRRLITSDEQKIVLGIKSVSTGSVSDFLEYLIDYSPTYCNEGFLMPLITIDDVDLDDIDKSLLQSSAGDFQLKRNFQYFTDENELIDIVKEEAKLIGCIPSISPVGKITLKPLYFPSETEAAQYSRTIFGKTFTNSEFKHDEVITTNHFPLFSKANNRIRNVASLSLNYNPRENKWNGKIITRYENSISLIRDIQTYEITPYSKAVFGDSEDEIENILIRTLNILGLPLIQVSFEVPLTKFYLTVGDIISVTNLQLPNIKTSNRGVEEFPGWISHIEWDLNKGLGRIDMLGFGQLYQGYTPSARISNGTKVSGDIWTLTTSDENYVLDSALDTAYFSGSDRVQLVFEDEWKTDAIEGTITNIDGADITIEFDSSPSAKFTNVSFTGSIIKYRPRTDTSLTDWQKRFAYIASGSTGGGYVFENPTSLFGP